MVVSIDSSLVQAFKKNIKVKKGIKKAQKQIKQTKAEQRKTEKSNNNLKNEVKELKANSVPNQADDKPKNQKSDKEQVNIVEKVNNKTEIKIQAQSKQTPIEEKPITKNKKKSQDKIQLSEVGDIEEKDLVKKASKKEPINSDIINLLKNALTQNPEHEKDEQNHVAEEGMGKQKKIHVSDVKSKGELQNTASKSHEQEGDKKETANTKQNPILKSFNNSVHESNSNSDKNTVLSHHSIAKANQSNQR